MNLGLHIFNFLQEKGSAELPGFGVFSIEKKSAQLDENTSTLLPPTYAISFEKNTSVFNPDLSKYIVEKTGENLFLVQNQIKEQVISWKEELSQNKKLFVEELGEFSEENDDVKLNPKRDFTSNPQYFGLEEINLNEIKSNHIEETSEDTDNQFVFSSSLLWAFLFILPVGGIIYLALTYQDQLFGKKSFDMSVKTSTHRIEEKPVVKDSAKVDSIQNSKIDSLRISK